MTEINVTSNKTDRAISFNKDFGESLEKSVELFGEEVVHSIFVAQAVIRCQSAARGVLDNEKKTEDEAVAAGQGYTPGIVRRAAGGQSAMNKVLEAVAGGKLSQAQVMEFLQKLQSAQPGEETGEAPAE